jgi:hypothetical protein
MIEIKSLKELTKRYENHAKAIEKEYKRKNIIHRLREDFGYAYTMGKIAAYKWIQDKLNN